MIDSQTQTHPNTVFLLVISKGVCFQEVAESINPAANIVLADVFNLLSEIKSMNMELPLQLFRVKPRNKRQDKMITQSKRFSIIKCLAQFMSCETWLVLLGSNNMLHSVSKQ